MRTLISALLLLVVFALPGTAQTVVTDPGTVRISFDHDKLNTTGYRQYLDSTTEFTVLSGLVDNSTGFSYPFPPMTPGLHELRITAFKVEGADTFNSEFSNVLGVRLVVVPSAPSNLRLSRTGDTVIIVAVLTRAGWEPTMHVRNL